MSARERVDATRRTRNADRNEDGGRTRAPSRLLPWILGALILLPPCLAGAHPHPDEDDDGSRQELEVEGSQPEPGEESDSTDFGNISTKELSQQSANPIGPYAYVFTQFALTFNDGDFVDGDAKPSGEIVFQPIIPIPLLGEDENEWRIVTRPTIALFADKPVPDPKRNFERETGLSDLLIPLPIALPDSIAGRWLIAAGPSFSLPTSTTDDFFGTDQFTAGVSGVFGYIGENFMFGSYPQYYRRIADLNPGRDQKDANFGNMFYWYFYNITDEWQIGTNPTIQVDFQAPSGEKWNVPMGFAIAKIHNVFGRPWRIEAGIEYSPIRQDDYGEVARFKINLIPIVPRPIKNPILNFLFGG